MLKSIFGHIYHLSFKQFVLKILKYACYIEFEWYFSGVQPVLMLLLYMNVKRDCLYFPSPQQGLGKLWPVSQVPPTGFVKKRMEYSPTHLFTCVCLCKCFPPTAAAKSSWVWPTKAKRFTIWLFIEKAYPPLPFNTDINICINTVGLPTSFSPGSVLYVYLLPFRYIWFLPRIYIAGCFWNQ